jgi:histidinol-phosphate aminotransferase
MAEGFAHPDNPMGPGGPPSRILRFRTFSKAYGLAGARIGFVIGEAGLVKCFDKVCNHFGVNRLAQAAALADLADQAYLQDV